MHPRVTAVEVVSPYILILTFADGSRGTVDGARWVLQKEPGVFAPLRDPALFAQVRLNHEFGVIEWPNGADVDPDTLYKVAHRERVS